MVRVNRVFCYSKEVAKQNRNKLPILQLVLSTIIFIVAVMVTVILFIDNMLLFMLIIFGYMGVIIYYSLILGLRLRARITGWATTDDGRIFRAMTVNNGQGLYFSGVAADRMINQLTDNNNLGKNLGGAVGAAAQFYSINRSAQYMSHPEIVAEMVEKAPNITGADVIEILKVYSITEKKHLIKVNCDFKSLRTDKVKYNKNICIEKSYNQLNDLINIINTHR